MSAFPARVQPSISGYRHEALLYAGQDEFVACLKLLVRDSRLRQALGRNGREYVAKYYRWDVVLRGRVATPREA